MLRGFLRAFNYKKYTMHTLNVITSRLIHFFSLSYWWFHTSFGHPPKPGSWNNTWRGQFWRFQGCLVVLWHKLHWCSNQYGDGYFSGNEKCEYIYLLFFFPSSFQFFKSFSCLFLPFSVNPPARNCKNTTKKANSFVHKI